MNAERKRLYLNRRRGLGHWIRSGEPMVWFNAGAVSFSLLAVFGLLWLLAWHGLGHFWPRELLEFSVNRDGEQYTVLGEQVSSERVSGEQLRAAGVSGVDGQWERRRLIKRGNRDFLDTDFAWLLDSSIVEVGRPAGVMRVERLEWGNLYGRLVRLEDRGTPLISTTMDSAATWSRFQSLVADNQALREEIRDIEREEVGRINFAMERLRLRERRLAMSDEPLPQWIADERRALEADYDVARQRLLTLYEQRERYSYRVALADGREVTLPLGQVVRAIQPNDMSLPARLDYYRVRLWEFLSDEPREANTEGGVYPAIFGTVLMVLLMSIMVTPFGVLAAVFLHEVAGQGRITRVFRAAVNNLAGVPSIVYGIFGLGFFVYGVGGDLDQLFFPEALPSPTYGTPGLMWASLTLALLTLPVVIVATEEGLARIPASIREGSLALGATRAETLWRVVLPMASPAMMTGVILAVARAAGEVAPLMLVGVVKLAPTLPLDGNFPYLHLEQKFMHLGFHIYDVGFQSPNIEAARPLVYATALLLVLIIALLNLAAVALRNRLRERYAALDGSV
ncbi:MAG: phosphate ABC transporter permease PstA [Halieaceae bacterium]|jgi:phosphate transport system permease protein|nr:phosphate ABC transporter permease PstA [Halieaceae bacterium]